MRSSALTIYPPCSFFRRIFVYNEKKDNGQGKKEHNMVHIGNEWDQLLADEFKKDYYQKLRRFLAYEYAHQRVYPDMYDIFNALKYTPYHQVKAVILGQDPYHGKGQAHGLCFSVQRGVTPPPSLQNIFAELHRDVGFQIPDHGNLEKWARQGVLMLNTVLTVRESQPNSHANKGWEILTDQIIRLLDALPSPVVFLLWGRNAKAKQALEEKYAGALASGKIVFRAVNVEEPVNEHFVRDFGLTVRGVVMAGNGRFEKFDSVWNLVRDPEKFQSCIQDGVKRMMGKTLDE